MPDADVQPTHPLRELETVLLSSTGEFLTKVVAMAVAGRPDLNCGLLVRHEGTRTRFTSMATTGEPATTLDQLQAKLDEGPSLDAARMGTQIDVLDPAADTRWPSYQREALTHSASVTSLCTPVPVVGTASSAVLTLYFTAPAAPEASDRLRMQDFATTISGLLSLALRIDRHEALLIDLRAALTSRAVIDMAKGVIMAQKRCSAEDAFSLLRTSSSRSNRKLRDVATQVVTSVTGHAPPQDPAFRWPT